MILPYWCPIECHLKGVPVICTDLISLNCRRLRVFATHIYSKLTGLPLPLSHVDTRRKAAY